LEVRLCDLHISLEGSWLELAVAKVHGELAERGINARPHVYLSDEWCSPDGVPAVAIPFYLAHPRLRRLERAKMLEVEGGTWRECLRLLRHEMGHAMQHAFGFERRKLFRETFGKPSLPYPESYRPNPASKRFVQHLDGWYAQSHPVEDFAETFAVWLTPRSAWRKRYQGWPALKKLQYVDALMSDLRGKPPKVRGRRRPYAISSLKHTLREHYQERQAQYSPSYAGTFDRDLVRLFDGAPNTGEPAAKFLRRHRREIRAMVARWTGEYVFTVDQVLKQIMGRCNELKLRTRAQTDPKMDFAILLAVHSMNYVHRVRDWHAM
jgi:hypothetical protein